MICGSVIQSLLCFLSSAHLFFTLTSPKTRVVKISPGDTTVTTEVSQHLSLETARRRFEDATRICLRFSLLKHIYPLELVKTAPASAKGQIISVSLEDVCRDETADDRWVEVPADFYDAKLHILDALQLRSDAQGTVEVLITTEETLPTDERDEHIAYKFWLGDSEQSDVPSLTKADVRFFEEAQREDNGHAIAVPIPTSKKNKRPSMFMEPRVEKAKVAHIPELTPVEYCASDEITTYSTSILERVVSSGSVRVGDIIDVQDTEGKWYEAVVRFACAEFICVHYVNWRCKWDDKLFEADLDSGRIARRGTHSKGPHIPHRLHRQRHTADEFLRLCYPNIKVHDAVPMGVAAYDPSRRCKISVRSKYGRFVCAEPDGSVNCNRSWCREWECFLSVPVPETKNKVVLESVAHHRYIGAKEETVHCGSDRELEAVTVVKRGDYFCFQSQVGGYLTVQSKDHSLLWDVRGGGDEFQVIVHESVEEELINLVVGHREAELRTDFLDVTFEVSDEEEEDEEVSVAAVNNEEMEIANALANPYDEEERHGFIDLTVGPSSSTEAVVDPNESEAVRRIFDEPASNVLLK